MTGWLEQDYSFWGGFELNYKGIEPKILIEPLMRDDIDKNTEEIQWYCFNGIPKLCIRIEAGTNNKTTLYDNNFNIIKDILTYGDIQVNRPCDDLTKQTLDLSIKLSTSFNFVRVDWFIFKNKLYFNELTFTPYSGLMKFDKKWNLKLGSWINLERGRHGF